jgi:hypothetical protein
MDIVFKQTSPGDIKDNGYTIRDVFGEVESDASLEILDDRSDDENNEKDNEHEMADDESSDEKDDDHNYTPRTVKNSRLLRADVSDDEPLGEQARRNLRAKQLRERDFLEEVDEDVVSDNEELAQPMTVNNLLTSLSDEDETLYEDMYDDPYDTDVTVPKQEQCPTLHNPVRDPKAYHSYMLTHKLKSSPGSHFAVVDSGTPIHIVFDHLFVSNTKEDHTPVAVFSGNASRGTHMGDLNARVRTHKNEYINLIDVNSTLVVPDCVRRLYSVSQATHKGYRVILDSDTPGLWVCEHFIPFANDTDTNLWLLPVLPPTSKDNGIYTIPKQRRHTGVSISPYDVSRGSHPRSRGSTQTMDGTPSSWPSIPKATSLSGHRWPDETKSPKAHMSYMYRF